MEVWLYRKHPRIDAFEKGRCGCRALNAVNELFEQRGKHCDTIQLCVVRHDQVLFSSTGSAGHAIDVESENTKATGAKLGGAKVVQKHVRGCDRRERGAQREQCAKADR